jgi:hypothetical protein
MRRLRKLCEAVRTIHSSSELRFFGVPDRDDIWIVRVAVKEITLIETAAGPLEVVMDDAARKLKALSQRLLAAISHPAEADDDYEHPGDSTIPPPPPTPRVPTTPSGIPTRLTEESSVPSGTTKNRSNRP